MSTDAFDAIRQQINFLQNSVLKLRLGSMMLEGMELLSPSNEEFLDVVEAYFMCAEKYAAKEFEEVIAYAMELKEDFSSIVKAAFDSKEENELRDFKALVTYNDVAELVYAAVFDN